ncbi:hypothetical protein FOL47_002367 [Perkinsus chesapeaki]|uniref:Ketoreductase domain-containing protein n=1 Tax=Perkinsus chesapeaki TaxID=330153 RepID=A0A7J6MF29_PERCH|nr:hypothetical protein FOL47_002367 [Perkinsus chesapeaki]
MSKPISFTGRVAVVTGAGGGLGRQYAIDLAKRGCKDTSCPQKQQQQQPCGKYIRFRHSSSVDIAWSSVDIAWSSVDIAWSSVDIAWSSVGIAWSSVVVNDLGGTFDGSGQSNRAADKVVDEIITFGGEAVANYNSVTDGDAIIKTAMDKWGRIDILINNAGILRDRSLAKMTDDDWKLIVDVHLNGVFKCTKAAWGHMLKQGYGRIVNVSSASGLYGNYGQVNYSMAKSGIVGMTKSMAQEGAKRGVLCNVVAPVAASRMTETVMPPDLLAQLSPEFVSPLNTGQVFEAGAGWFAQVQTQRSRGVTLKWPYQPEDLLDESIQSKITDFSKGAVTLNSSGEATMSIIQIRDDAVTPPSAAKVEHADSAMKSVRIFDIIKAYFDHPSKPGSSVVKKLGTTFTFEIYEGKKVGEGKAKKWTLNLKDASGKCYETEEADGACTFTLTDSNFLALVKNELQPQAAFMQGKLKIKGDLGAAMKFTPDVLPKFDAALADNVDLSPAEVIEAFLKTAVSKM